MNRGSVVGLAGGGCRKIILIISQILHDFQGWNNQMAQIQQKYHPIATGKQMETMNETIINSDPNTYTGKALVVVTESPTYNIISWATKTYQENILPVTGKYKKNDK